jgi:hypothetical protein
MNRGRIQRIADEFWTAVGWMEPFPRQLETAVLWALPLAIFKLPRLWISDIESWLSERGISFHVGTGNRPLHGCLLAYGGRGCVLLNGADSSEDLRFSLAHEAAHFILDYFNPRQLAVKQLGPAILEVFDGRRLPTVKERVHAILGRVPVGFHAHLMEREENGAMGLICELEDSADLLAVELLAPQCEIRMKVCHLGHLKDQVEVTAQILQKDFGLPQKVAGVYACWLYPRVRVRSVREWLRQKKP